MAEALIRVKAKDETPEGFRSVERRLKEFGSSLKSFESRASVFSALRTGILGVVAALGGNALARAFSETVNAADKLNEVSLKTGIATESLSELKFAAELSNVSFDDLQVGLKKFASAIDDNSDAFKRIGLDVKNFSSIDQALSAVADTFARMNSPIQEAALAVDLFGRSGTQLLPFLKLGSAGISQLREEARSLGAVVSGDLARGADQFNDNVSRLQAGAQGFLNAITADLLPGLNQFLERTIKIKQVTGSFFGDIVVEEIADPFRSTQDSIKATQENLVQLNKELREANRLIKDGDISPRARIGLQNAAKDVESQIKIQKQRLEVLQFDREQEIKEDPKLRALAESGKGIRENTNIQRFLVTPKAKEDEKKPKTGRSDFEVLRESLESKLKTQRNLTEELALVEDKRFQKLNANQKNELIGLARKNDALEQEKRLSKLSDSASEIVTTQNRAESSVRVDFVESLKQNVEREYQLRNISAQEYYSRLRSQEEVIFSIRKDLASKEIQAQQNIVFSKDSKVQLEDRVSATKKLIEATAQLSSINQQESNVLQENTSVAKQAIQQELIAKASIAKQLNDLRGTTDAELNRRLLEDQFKDVPKEFRQSATFQLFLDTSIAEDRLSDFERNIGRIQDDLRDKETRISIDFDTGAIATERLAQQNIIEVRREAVSLIADEIRKVESLRAENVVAFGPEQEARLRRLKTSLEELNATTDDFFKNIRDVAQSPLSNLLFDLQKGAKDAADAFKDFGNAIQDALFRKGSEAAADAIIGTVGKAFKIPSGGGENAFSFLDGLGGSAINAIGGFLGGRKEDLLSSAVESATSGSDIAVDFEGTVNSVQQDLLGFGGALTGSSAQASEFDAALAGIDVAGPLLGLVTSATTAGTAQAGIAASTASAAIAIQALALATTKAATEIAIASTIVSASAGAGGGGSLPFLAKGGVLEGGALSRFAKGGVLADGDVEKFALGDVINEGDNVHATSIRKFAAGDVVSRPTLFRMAGNKTGLMGEAGPEAIIPVKKSGSAFFVNAVDEKGGRIPLPLTRDSAGKLTVMIGAGRAKGFATGGIFLGGDSYAYADGGIVNRDSHDISRVDSKGLRISHVDSSSKFAMGGIFNGGAVFRPSTKITSLSNRSDSVVAFASGGIVEGGVNNTYSSGVMQMIRLGGMQAFASGGVVDEGIQSIGDLSANRFPFGSSATGSETTNNNGVTIIQNIVTEDVESFRRSRAAIANDARQTMNLANS